VTTLITGGTGLLGNNIIRRLLARGEAVRALVRPGRDLRPLADLKVEIVRGDVRDAAAVSQAVREADTVVHAAAIVHIGRRGMSQQRATNVEGTRNVALAALRESARLLLVSSVDALGASTAGRPADEETPGPVVDYCPYAVTKWEAEQVVLGLVSRGLDAVIVNPGFVLGPWDWTPSSGRMLLQVARGLGRLAPRGANTFCDARDVADGILAAIRRGRCGKRYILTGDSLSYLEAWRLFAELSSASPPRGEAGPLLLSLVGRVGDLWALLSRREGDVNSAATAMAQLHRSYSNERARRELGYSTRDVRESAKDAYDWFRSHGYLPA